MDLMEELKSSPGAPNSEAGALSIKPVFATVAHRTTLGGVEKLFEKFQWSHVYFNMN